MISNSSELLGAGLYFNQQPGTDSKEISDSSDQACPICSLKHISSDKNQCPQCDADLTCFKVLNTLSDDLEDTISEASQEEYPEDMDERATFELNRLLIEKPGVVSLLMEIQKAGDFCFETDPSKAPRFYQCIDHIMQAYSNGDEDKAASLINVIMPDVHKVQSFR